MYFNIGDKVKTIYNDEELTVTEVKDGHSEHPILTLSDGESYYGYDEVKKIR